VAAVALAATVDRAAVLWLPEKEEAPGRVTRASYAETSKKELSEIGSLSLR